jgi:hypothetical protein
MVFTNNQVTAFFEDANQMAICHRTRMKLNDEGIDHPTDLKMFKADGFKKIADSLNKPAGRVPNPDANAAIGDTIATPRFAMSAKSWLRLEQAAELVRFYAITQRTLTAANIQWDPVIESSHEYWESLTQQIKDSPPVLPKITKSLPIMKWQEAIDTYFSRVHGARSVPLTYIIRKNVAIADPLPSLVQDKPYSADNGSLEAEMVATASHSHSLYRIDNATVHYALTQATLGTQYASSVSPFDKANDGRGAYLALKTQFAGPDKYQELLKKQTDFLMTRKWTGQSSLTLETHISHHRQAFVQMEQCATHIHVVVPTPFTRVAALLDSIECVDARLQAAMAKVRCDDSPTGLHHDFEGAVATILPQDPVALKRMSNKRNATAMVSAINVPGATTTLKIGTGTTGVPLRYHLTPEYNKLRKDQKMELNEHRNERVRMGLSRHLPGHPDGDDPLNKSPANKKPKKGKEKGGMAATIAALAAGQKAFLKTAAADKKELQTQMSALVSSINGKEATSADSSSTRVVASTTATAPNAVLNGIIRKAKHG